MAQASVVMKLVTVDVPVEQVTLTMTKREAAYVYAVLSAVSDNKREWGEDAVHPVYYELAHNVFEAGSKPSNLISFRYTDLPIEVRDWVASQ